jgi:hypothetical protein
MLFYISSPLPLHVRTERPMYLGFFLFERFLRSLSRPSISADPALLLAKLSRMFRLAFQTMSTAMVLKVMNEMNMDSTAVVLVRVADRVARVNSLQRIRQSSLSF